MVLLFIYYGFVLSCFIESLRRVMGWGNQPGRGSYSNDSESVGSVARRVLEGQRGLTYAVRFDTNGSLVTEEIDWNDLELIQIHTDENGVMIGGLGARPSDETVSVYRDDRSDDEWSDLSPALSEFGERSGVIAQEPTVEEYEARLNELRQEWGEDVEIPALETISEVAGAISEAVDKKRLDKVREIYSRTASVTPTISWDGRRSPVPVTNGPRSLSPLMQIHESFE